MSAPPLPSSTSQIKKKREKKRMHVHCESHHFFIIWKAIPLWNQSCTSHWNQNENAYTWNNRCIPGRRENGSQWMSSHSGARLSFPGVSLHSNLFLDSLDEIKRQVDRDGCQEETESFFPAGCRWLSGLQIWLERCRLLQRVNGSQTTTEAVFVAWLTTHTHTVLLQTA